MPLGESLGSGNDSNLCGLEWGFNLLLPEMVSTDTAPGCYDFIVAPLMHPKFRPSIQNLVPDHLVRAGSDLKLKPGGWKEDVVCKISSWIDLDSENEKHRMESEFAFKHEIDWASYLTLQACLLPTPKGTSFVNYARCVSQILQEKKDMKLWLRIPLENPDAGYSARPADNLIDAWETWNSFRVLCGHHGQLCVALDHLSGLPSENSLKRWFGEPVAAAIIHKDRFLTKPRANLKYLPKRHQKLISDFFNHSIQIVLTGENGTASDCIDYLSIVGSRESLAPCLEYIRFLFKRMDPLPLLEHYEFGIADILQSPFRPLDDLAEAVSHEYSEKDLIKNAQYEKAIREALLDRVPDEKASAVTTVLVIVGAGRGPLVKASLKVAKEVGRKIKIYAVEENINTVVSLNALVCANKWNSLVTIVTTNLRNWDAPEMADILVCQLLGSFGDDELCTGFIDEAQKFLKEDGISIPSSYTSFLQPITAAHYHCDVHSNPDILNGETACVVNMNNVTRLAPCQPVFTFTHPNRNKASNQQSHKKLHFVIPEDTGSAIVHGFAGYFDATLCKDVHLGNEPSTTTTPNLRCYPIFFPLRSPIYVHRGSALDVHFWRCSDSTKVWYEWCVTSPSTSPIHNCNGRSYWIDL